MRTVKLLDAVLLTIPFGACWYLAYAENLAEPYYRKGNWLVIALFFVIYVTYGRIYDGFRVSISRVSEMFISQTLALLITDGILLVVTWLLTKHFPPVWPLVLTLAVQMVLSIVWCIGAHQWYFHRYDPQKTAVVYDTREGLDTLIAEYGLDKRFQVVATADVATALNDQLQILDGIEAIFLFGTHSHERNIILKQCVARDIEVYLIPRIGDVIMSGAERIHMFHLPMLRVGRYDPNPEYLFTKRAFDLLVSGLALVMLSPIMLLVAAAVKLTDGGPAFYRQCRLTKDGKTFDVLKFRSMRVDAEKDGVARLNVLDVQKQIRSLPKPVIAAVNGFAIGGGHVLHVVCDLTIASENAIFGQTGPRVGSFDAGFGSSYLARVVGQKKAREIWFLCRKYNAQEALDMGLVNKVVPLDRLEDEYVQWAEEMMLLSPLALRMIKAGLNAELDGQAGIQELAGDATMLYYMTDEAQEGGKAFLEKRRPRFEDYPKFP